MINAVFITNIPAPYSLDLFNAIQDRDNDIELSVIYSAMSRNNRIWTIDKNKFRNTYSLDSYIFSKKQSEYRRFIHIPRGTWGVLNRIKPSILLVYEYSLTSLLAFIWCKIHRKKYVHVTEGTLWSERGLGIAQKILRKVIINCSDSLVACSTKSREKLISWGANTDSITTILLTSDTKKYIEMKKMEENSKYKYILYVGSISNLKGTDLLINGLKKSDPSIVLWIAGSGENGYVQTIHKKVKEEGLEERVIFHGFLEGEELLSLYQRADAFILPSRGDCYGLVLVEAYCSRLPIIASKFADGAYDVVNDGINGLIIDPFDSDQVGRAITDIIKNEMYKKNANCVDLKRFSIENEANQFEMVIQNVLRQ